MRCQEFARRKEKGWKSLLRAKSLELDRLGMCWERDVESAGLFRAGVWVFAFT
jgi:hypothetical protein